MKLKVSKEIKEQILAITNGEITPFYLRKKHNADTLEMYFYTKPKTIRIQGEHINNLIRVPVGYPEGLKKRRYYLIDGNMNVTPLRTLGRGKEFTLIAKIKD